MITEKQGKIVKGLGGLYETLITQKNGQRERIICRAKGTLRRGEEKLLIGDEVTVSVDDSSPDEVVISSLHERRNALIRPPMANLDMMFAVFAVRMPEPVLSTVDKLTAIALHNRMETAIVITKSDLSPDAAEDYAEIYRKAGFPVFVTSSLENSGTDALFSYLQEHLTEGKTAAFAGASGVGKSTLMNTLFPHLSLATSEISRKVERGKHTTRHVELFPISENENSGYLADTPGFSLLDFAHFDFFSLEELLPAFPELLPYLGKCRYADCAHVKEGKDECAVAQAAEEGKIPQSRLASYREIYQTLKNKNKF